MKSHIAGVLIAGVIVVASLVWLTRIRLQSPDVVGVPQQASTTTDSKTPVIPPDSPPPASTPLNLPSHTGRPKESAVRVNRQTFIRETKANERIEDVALRYGLPEKVVGADAAIWKCADGEVIVKAYNHPGQVLQNDGSWAAVDDYRIKSVSTYPGSSKTAN